MNQWIRKIHTYLGLLNFSILIVFGIAGLVVTFQAPDIFHQKEGPAVTYRDFTASPAASDKEVGATLSNMLDPAHAGPPVVHRNQAHQVVADFYSVNGLVRATVLEPDHRVQVQTYRNSIWRFFDNAHATTIQEKSRGSAVHLWAWYIEFSIWSLIAMALTGAWLGLVTRWRFRWSRLSFAAGCVAFVALYILER